LRKGNQVHHLWAGAGAALVLSSAVLIAGMRPALPESETFRGRLVNSLGAKAIDVEIVINDYSSADEILKLKQILDSGDVKKFYAHFQGMDKGEIRVKGETGSQLTLYAAQASAAENGRIIEVFSGSRTIGSREGRFYGQYPFLCVRLELDDAGSGEGRVYEAVQIAIAPQGFLVMRSYLNAPLLLVNVRKAAN
jgi:hypothetical protein